MMPGTTTTTSRTTVVSIGIFPRESAPGQSDVTPSPANDIRARGSPSASSALGAGESAGHATHRFLSPPRALELRLS
jgi:hypothetical protein